MGIVFGVKMNKGTKAAYPPLSLVIYQEISTNITGISLSVNWGALI
jgi:hypothetical protein